MKNGGVLQVCGRRIAGALIKFCDWVVPKSYRIVLVTLPDGDDQGASICRELMNAGWSGSIHWLVHRDPVPFAEWQIRRGLTDIPIRFLRLYSLRGVWSYLRARCVFYTHGALFNYSPPKRKVVVNLWHGMPIKKIWRGVPGSELPLSTFLVSTSPFFSEILMRASGFGPERMLVTGLPRNDFLTRSRPMAVQLAAQLRGSAEKMIFFLPTYRHSARGFKTQDGIETNNMLGLNPQEGRALHAWLAHNRCKLVVKPHPMSINAGKSFLEDECWSMVDEDVLFEAGLGLYELLGQADLLITDVSSVYVDFLVTEKPQILFFPDMEQYESTRGLLLQPLDDYAPGPIAKDFHELLSALDAWRAGADDWRQRRTQLRDLMVPGTAGSAARELLSKLRIQ